MITSGGEGDSSYTFEGTSSYDSDWYEDDDDELVEITKEERNSCDYITSYQNNHEHEHDIFNPVEME